MRPFPLRFLRAVLLAAFLGLSACMAPCDYGQGVAVPVTMRENLPLVPVEVNGNRVPFMLDTGANQTVILAEGARLLQLQTDLLRSSRGTGIAGVSRERNALVARLRFGGHDLRNLTVPVATLSSPIPAAGLLGGDVLSVAEVDLDLPAGRATLHDRRRCRMAALPWQGEAIPFAPAPAGLVVIDVALNGLPLRALFDTGASLTVARRDLAPALGLDEAALARLPAGIAHGAGSEAGAPMRLMPGAVLRVGGETVPLPLLGLVDLPDRPFDLILGRDYIAARRVWISHAERRLYVGPAATAAPAAPPAPAAR